MNVTNAVKIGGTLLLFYGIRKLLHNSADSTCPNNGELATASPPYHDTHEFHFSRFTIPRATGSSYGVRQRFRVPSGEGVVQRGLHCSGSLHVKSASRRYHEHICWRAGCCWGPHGVSRACVKDCSRAFGGKRVPTVVGCCEQCRHRGAR